MKESQNLEIEFKLPTFFSETRFANSIKKVYFNFREDYPALIQLLEDIQMNKFQGNSTERQKALEASELSNSIYNKKFAVILSGTCDIYEVFSHGINILQKVNILPHTKYDQFMGKCVYILKSMCENIDHSDCLLHGAKTCFWPKLHQDLDEMTSKGTMRGIPIGQMDKDGSKTRRGQKQTQLNEDESNEACFLLVAKNHVKELAQKDYQDLNNNIYTEEDKVLIE